MTSAGTRGEAGWRAIVAEAQDRTLARPEIDASVVPDEVDELRDVLAGADEDVMGTVLADEIGTWRRALEFLRSVNNRPLASPQDVSDAEAGVTSSRDALIERIVETALLPLARRYLNRSRSGRNRSGTLSRSGGLGATPEAFRLETVAAAYVEQVMREQSTAAIGIAGQRGSGKTTLIEYFTNAGASLRVERTAGRFLVSAPVQYDARDFFLHVFAELCQSIVGRDARARGRPEPAVEKPRRLTLAGYFAWVLLLRVIVIAAGVVAAYLVYRVAVDPLLVAPVTALVGLPPPPRADVPEPVLFQWFVAVAVSWALLNLGLFARSFRLRTPPLAQMFRRRKRPDLPLFLGSLLVLLVGIVVFLLWTRQRLALPDTALLFALGPVVALLVALSFWRVTDWQPAVPVSRSQQRSFLRDFAASATSGLNDLARSYLEEIRFQQSFTSGWGGKISVSSPIAGGELNKTEGVTLARVSWTLPETVANLRALLAATADEYDQVVLGIDEVDKIENPEAARRFIDDLKAIFQVKGCYFLVSVSDEAVDSFGRRGLPFRDSWDSAFDDVISVDVGGLAESENILSTRVVAMPTAFIALCHALSGGLPRDLIRFSRELYALPRPVTLAAASRLMVVTTFMTKLPLVARPAVTSNSPSAVLLIAWAQRATAGFEHHGELRGRLEDLENVKSGIGLDDQFLDGQKEAVLRGCLECEAIVVLALTVAEHCAVIQRDDVRDADIRGLASLGDAKKDLALHPTLALLRIQDFRTERGLPSLPGWPR